MTQHIYPTTDTAGKKVQITLGWDRPLREVFANVFAFEDEDTLGEFPAVSTMDGTGPESQSADGLKNWLAERGYSMPESVYARLADDIGLNRGNVLTEYDANGIVQATYGGN